MCIYCDSDDLTVSDIIPYALTGSKVTKKFVCKKHNALTNFEFEKDVINQWVFFRNQLGLTTRDGETIKFKASVFIDDIEIINVNLSDKKFFYSNCKQVLTTDYKGNKIKIGNINKLKQIKGAKPTLLSMENVFVKYDFSLFELIASEKMKRTIAKISYEWHCYIHGLVKFDPCYESIVSYILNGPQTNDEEIVQNVIDGHAIEAANQLCELGTNSLYEFIDTEGNCYVVFNFWNVIIYKTKIYDTKKRNYSNNEIIRMYRYNLDGTKDDTYFGIMGAINIASEPSEKAIRRLQKLYLDNLKSLVTTKVLTLFTVKQMIDDMSSDLELFKTGKIDISNFLNYEEGERIFSIQLALKFAEMENSYDYEIGFNKNLMNVLSCEELLKVNEEDKITFTKQIMELDVQGRLTELLEEGVTVFGDIYEIEKQKLKEKPEYFD